MRAIAIVIPCLAGCSLYFGGAHGGGGGGGSGSGSAVGDVHRLTMNRSVAAEGAIHGVDADQQGAVWIAYWTPGNYPQSVKPVVTLVHWDPTTRQRLQTFTYDDLWSPVSGVALVQGQIWLNYRDVARSDQVIRVIDPSNGAIERTLGTTGLDVAAMASDRALISDYSVLVVDSASGGVTSSFSSPVVLDPGDMGGIPFSGTQQGIAWRPGEIWVGNWYMPMEIFDESGQMLGTIAFDAIRSGSAGNVFYLKFDRGQLLVGGAGQLTWYDVQ
jgi:hypothetical protein